MINHAQVIPLSIASVRTSQDGRYTATWRYTITTEQHVTLFIPPHTEEYEYLSIVVTAASPADAYGVSKEQAMARMEADPSALEGSLEYMFMLPPLPGPETPQKRSVWRSGFWSWGACILVAVSAAVVLFATR